MTAQPTPEGTPKGAWKITFLLFLFMLVNFADKIVVGLAGAPIMDELKLTPEQFGFLGSSFFSCFRSRPSSSVSSSTPLPPAGCCSRWR